MSGETQARLVTVTRPMWKTRLRHGLPRGLLMALSAAGLLANLRLIVSPPGPIERLSAGRTTAPADRAAEAYAVLFVRRYLTWSASRSQASGRAMEAFEGPRMEPDAGLLLPTTGSETVAWAEVVQSRVPFPGESVYTVAAETDPIGLQYLTVAIRREGDGTLRLLGYPAFVGPPVSAPAMPSAGVSTLDDPALEAVVRRAIGNYLTGSADELASDLTRSAQVSLPERPLQPLTIERPVWAPGGGAVQEIVQAVDAAGARCTLEYELDVSREQGRWEISAIQTIPGEG
jgi:hypothetical protein